MPLSWSHNDSDAVTTAKAAVEAARNGSWEQLDAPTRRRYLRMLLILSLQAGQMIHAYPRPRGPEWPIEYGTYTPGQYRDRRSLEIASVVLRTPQLILPARSYSVLESTTTGDGEPAVTSGDAQKADVGALPIVVWVIGIAACAIASIVIAQTAGEAVDRQLTRSEETKRLLGTQANAVDAVIRHTEREDKAGKAIPFSDAELETLRSLLKAQMAIAEKRETRLPSPFAGAAETLDDLGNTLKGGLEDALPWVLAAGGIYLLLR
jgi:hypothetical protein